MSADSNPSTKQSHSQPRPEMTDQLLQLLRERVATRFYEQPRVIDVIARRLLRLGSS